MGGLVFLYLHWGPWLATTGVFFRFHISTAMLIIYLHLLCLLGAFPHSRSLAYPKDASYPTPLPAAHFYSHSWPSRFLMWALLLI